MTTIANALVLGVLGVAVLAGCGGATRADARPSPSRTDNGQSPTAPATPLDVEDASCADWVEATEAQQLATARELLDHQRTHPDPVGEPVDAPPANEALITDFRANVDDACNEEGATGPFIPLPLILVAAQVYLDAYPKYAR